MVTLARVIKAVVTHAVQGMSYAGMNPEHFQVVSGIIYGQDVFTVLPTGFGKSLHSIW